MGEPGVYVIVRDGSWSSIGINSGGFDIHRTTVLGLDVVLAFFGAYAGAGFADHAPAGWLADEGVLVDIDRRILMVNSQQLWYARRLVFLEALARAWPGWEIRWAYRGRDDFCDYPGLVNPAPAAYARFRYEPAGRGPGPAAEPVFDLSGLDHQGGVYTVDRGDGPIAMGVYNDDAVAAGPQFADWAAVPPGPVRLEWHPPRGLHVDVPARTVGIWTHFDYGALARSWPDLWPGWRLELWEDRAEEQVRRCGGALTMPPPDLDGARRKFGRDLDSQWLECTREWWTNPDYRAFYLVVAPTPWRYRPFVAAGLTEDAYADLRERAVGTRPDPEIAARRREDVVIYAERFRDLPVPPEWAEETF
jgi:hypothetical protein